MGWGRRWEGGSGWETHVHPWLIHVNVWQRPLQYCKVISLQLKFKKIKQIKNKNKMYIIYLFFFKNMHHSICQSKTLHFIGMVGGRGKSNGQFLSSLLLVKTLSSCLFLDFFHKEITFLPVNYQDDSRHFIY